MTMKWWQLLFGVITPPSRQVTSKTVQSEVAVSALDPDNSVALLRAASDDSIVFGYTDPAPLSPPRGKGRASGSDARGRIKPCRLRFPTLQRSPGWHCLHARVNNQPGYCDRRCCLKLDQCGTLSGAFYREFDQLHTNYAHACPMTAIKLNGVQRFQGLPLRPSPGTPTPGKQR